MLFVLLQTELGRDLQGKRWGPRPLDLDIIFYEGLQHREEGLEIPHPRWQERPFVQAGSFADPQRLPWLPPDDCACFQVSSYAFAPVRMHPVGY